jgi:hypothetical protein
MVVASLWLDYRLLCCDWAAVRSVPRLLLEVVQVQRLLPLLGRYQVPSADIASEATGFWSE